MIGNLSVGGTGKTPHVQYLADYFQKNKRQISIVSRGYGRKTKGMIVATAKDTAHTIGDEPNFYFDKNPFAQIIVSEERAKACRWVDEQSNNTDKSLILLDDAYQHRYIKATVNIVLSPHNNPYYEDFVLPVGRLREFRKGIQRADFLIITKCPKNISENEKKKIVQKVNRNRLLTYFSHISYQALTPLFNAKLPSQIETIVLVTAIAETHSLECELKERYPSAALKALKHPDHHDFSIQDVERIQQFFGKFAPEKSVLISTEKDAVKLRQFENQPQFSTLPWFIQPIGIKIDKEEEFLIRLEQYVSKIPRIS